MSLKLVIGNKNYSSWSLRAWLFLRESQLEFEEIRIPLFTANWQREIGRYTPAKRVPVLIDDDLSVWDSMAIYEYVLEQYPNRVGWPVDVKARAIARAIAAEMHAGFMAVRDELPQNIRARRHREFSNLSGRAQQQINRIQQIWSKCRQHYGQSGPWLFGEFSIADVVYAPVALRFVTYEISLEPEAQSFIDAVQALPSIQDWIRDSELEPESLPFIDELAPTGDTSLTPGI